MTPRPDLIDLGGGQPAPDRTAFRFLIEEFTEVGDTVDPVALSRFQHESARTFFGFEDYAIAKLEPGDFQDLRRLVRDWLRELALDPELAFRVTIEGTIALAFAPGVRDLPHVSGDARDVFWFYLVNLVTRVRAWSQMGVCVAPRSTRAARPGPCGRLFVRRGRAKEFCSEQCRARVATQRARNVYVQPVLDDAVETEWRTAEVLDITSRGRVRSMPLVVDIDRLRAAHAPARRRKRKGKAR